MSINNDIRIKLLRLLPEQMKGKQRLARLLLSKHLKKGDAFIKDKFGFVFHVPYLAAPIALNILVDGIYEPDLLRLLLNYLDVGDTFLDIGANIGTFSLPCSSRVGVKGQVIAIEASPSIFTFLKESVAINNVKNVLLNQLAISSVDGEELEFYEAPADNFGMGSFGPQFHSHPIRLLSRSLDDFLDEQKIVVVKAIKVDVEGFEARVFQGAAKLLTQPKAPLIAFEFSDWAERRIRRQNVGDSQCILLDYGYRIWRLSSYIRKGGYLNKILLSGTDTLVAAKQ